ncbi:MAG TPA: serine/threonine-protein kinase [Byssovorax sp.]
MALPNKTKIPIGTVLAGKYRITREIGRGGMAAVYEAENVDIGKRVAIKVLAQELTTSAIVVERFLREARAAAAIRSPYICDVYDSGRLEDGRPFLVLELLEGESLYERMTKIRYLDVDTTVHVIVQTCRGLTKAHAANIVHRDLKPENIFLTKDEEGNLLAKILDFGLAKFYAPMGNEGQPQQARLTREGAVFGTPAYMSPEQVRGQGAVDHRADLWALGCITYECVTGKTVWSTEQGVAMTFAQIANAPIPRPNALRADLPPEFTAWFDKALDRNIERRFQSAREFGDELGSVFHHDTHRSSLHTGGDSAPVIAYQISEADILKQSTPGRRADPAAPTAAPPPPRPEATSPPAPSAAVIQVPSGDFAAGPPSARASKHGFVATPSGREGAPSLTQPKPSALGRAVVVVGALGIVGGAAYAGYTQFLEPTLPGTSASASASASASTAPTASTTPQPSADAGAGPSALPWEPTVREAQQAIATGDLKNALKLLKDAFEKGGHGVPRTMMEHVAVALSSGDKAACKLTGLARPRTYDLAAGGKSVNAGRPSIVVGPKGPVIAWTDAHEGSEHAYAVALDDAMRDEGTPVDITPEAGSVARVDLARAGDKIVVAYWDAKGTDAGVHARFLEADGRIAGPSVAVGQVKSPNANPSIARAADGSLFIAWTDEIDKDSEDLLLRRYGAKLEPQGDAVRLTDLVQNTVAKPRVRSPIIAIEANALHVAFRLERDPSHLVELLRLPLADASKGVEPPKKGVAARADRNVGEMALVNSDKGKADAPSLACGAGACFVVWHGEAGGGASAAYVDPTRAQPLWRKKFSKQGTRPAVGVAADGSAEIVWFDGGKVHAASINRDGVGQPTKIARVSGEMQAPAVAAGAKPGEWYVAWQDYEAGHLEAYAARIACTK